MTITVLKKSSRQTAPSFICWCLTLNPSSTKSNCWTRVRSDTQQHHEEETRRLAVHYSLKTSLGMVPTAALASGGRTPPDYHFWLIKKDAPAFVRF